MEVAHAVLVEADDKVSAARVVRAMRCDAICSLCYVNRRSDPPPFPSRDLNRSTAPPDNHNP